MNIRIFDSKDQLFEASAQVIVKAILEKPQLRLGLAAGRTMVPLYAHFVQQALKQKLDLSELQTFNLDEYVGVSQNHSASFYHFTQEHFFKPLRLKGFQTHALNGSVSDLAYECQKYEELIRNSGGIDLQILGLGLNGHIGFNEPGSKSASRTRCVQLSVETRSQIPKELFSNAVPEFGLTLGVANLLESRKIILIASGTAKAIAVQNCFYETDSEQWPASMLQNHPRLVVHLDLDAAKKEKISTP